MHYIIMRRYRIEKKNNMLILVNKRIIVLYSITDVCVYLAELSHDLPEETVQYGQLPAEVDVSLKAACIADTVQVGDLVQELLHGAPLHL